MILRRAPVTLALIVLNVLDYIWVATTGSFSDNYSLIGHGALVGELVRSGEWWRIVTGAFEHGGFWHIALNMFALYQVGTFVEIIGGRARMLAAYLISMVGSGIAVTLFQPDVVTVGASGAIFGLFGALVAIGLRMGKDGRSLISQTVPIIAINLGLGFVIPNISYVGHIGGLISGFLAGLLLFVFRRRSGMAGEEERTMQLADDPRAMVPVGTQTADGREPATHDHDHDHDEYHDHPHDHDEYHDHPHDHDHPHPHDRDHVHEDAARAQAERGEPPVAE
jgi:rhomboid protease GluP